MRRNNRSLLKRLAQMVILAQALGILILIILAVLDLDGWREFAWSVGVSFFAQAIIALILFGILLTVLPAFKNFLAFSLSEPLLLGIAAVLALPFLSPVFHRPVDIYDVVQTIPLIVDLHLLIGRFERFMNEIRLQQARPRQRSPFPPTAPPAYPTAHANEAPYGDLLRKVGGNRETAERLIAYERKRAPHASRDELVKRAIVSWELDNR
jgi:hypothetical protein